MKRYTVLVPWFLLLTASAAAQVVIGTVQGLGPITVTVEQLSSQVVEAGLSVSQLTTDVELRLRRSGITVRHDASSYLYVRVTAVKVAASWAYYVEVEMREATHLDRNHGMTYALIWEDGGIGLVSASTFVQNVREDVGDRIDKFCNDYLAANQK